MARRFYKFSCDILNFGFISKFFKKVKMDEAVISVPPLQGKSKRMQIFEDSRSKRPRLEVQDRVKRKKVAILLAYSGQGYFGMQRNPETKTIEEDLLNAMLKAGLLTDDAFSVPQYVQFQRAARTDKGVSAARQIISLKLPEEASVEKINEHLPEQIRTFAIIRTTKGFNCKTACDARTYLYMLPTFALAPAGMEHQKEYRLPSEVLLKVNSTLKIFEGTHNFHNFTSRKKPADPSANRYIMSFECGEPFLSGEMEFVTMKVKGQSFMLHQIRKMVGLTIAVVKGLTNADTIIKAWEADRFDLPVAPGLGLVLDEIHYDRYNQRYRNDGIHDALDWAQYKDDLDSFKRKFIYPTIVETEEKEESMLNWLETLPLHSYNIRKEKPANQGEQNLEAPPAEIPLGEINGEVHTTVLGNEVVKVDEENDLAISTNCESQTLLPDTSKK